MERFELENSREFKAAMELENALNDTCFNYKSFAESIKYFHPTLQQSLFRLIREIINVQADDSRYYDDRNRASHEVAKLLKEIIENQCLPYIQVMYLECTCSQISIEKWKQKMKNSRPLNYGWLVRRIKIQLPLLYKELCLEFYNPWEDQCKVNRDYYILVHSAIEYFIRKE